MHKAQYANSSPPCLVKFGSQLVMLFDLGAAVMVKAPYLC
jgi:hypothetical protein